MGMSGLSVYIHIPFCKHKCAYCDFPSFEGREDMTEAYLYALLSEIKREEATAGKKADTVYIGGGTPSYIPPEFICRIMEELNRKYEIAPGAEISMEMNPGTLKEGAAEQYLKAGINRISLGCQSFNDRSLRRLGRIHDEKDILTTYDILKGAGFLNVNLDLISDIPGESITDLERSLKKAVSLEPEHISVYSLIIEEGTELFRQYEKGEVRDFPDEGAQLKNDACIRKTLNENGYDRYEISNYAKSGYECAHNLTYWNRGDYRGFGLGAASLTGNRRFTNTGDMVYIKHPGEILTEDRTLSEQEAMEEFFFLGLRKCKGVSEMDFKESFQKSIPARFKEVLEDQIKSGFMTLHNGRYFYNEKGLDISNILMADFLTESGEDFRG